MGAISTYTEECTQQPSHYTLEMRLRNVPLEDALAQKREECPVCGAEVTIEEDTDE